VTPLLREAGITKEPLPPGVTGVGLRTTPDLFGFGLLEAVAEHEILRHADPDDRDHDGISGRPHWTDDGIGRFGRKGQVSNLTDFITDAWIYEQGITSEAEPDEQTIAGEPLPDGVDPTLDPEISEEDLEASIRFVQFLAPPSRVHGGMNAVRGARVFSEIGCASCHVPALRTDRHPIRAMSRKKVFAYTDLLLHDMGEELSDICNGEALPSEFRTEPLMGLRFSTIYMHDGRATTIEQAIEMHGGEATGSRDRFLELSHRKRSQLLRFLETL